MPTDKFTRGYEVEAGTQTEAFEQCRQNPAESRRDERSGRWTGPRKTWGSTLKKQITGK